MRFSLRGSADYAADALRPVLPLRLDILPRRYARAARFRLIAPAVCRCCRRRQRRAIMLFAIAAVATATPPAAAPRRLSAAVSPCAA